MLAVGCAADAAQASSDKDSFAQQPTADQDVPASEAPAITRPTHRRNSSGSSAAVGPAGDSESGGFLGLLHLKRAAAATAQNLATNLAESLSRVPFQLVISVTKFEGPLMLWVAPPPSDRWAVVSGQIVSGVAICRGRYVVCESCYVKGTGAQPWHYSGDMIMGWGMHDHGVLVCCHYWSTL